MMVAAAQLHHRSSYLCRAVLACEPPQICRSRPQISRSRFIVQRHHRIVQIPAPTVHSKVTNNIIVQIRRPTVQRNHALPWSRNLINTTTVERPWLANIRIGTVGEGVRTILWELKAEGVNLFLCFF
ncbi:putative pecanex-like protein 1 [Sesbania bispinosa]|nr:putative pecanex-like protein 1 [Sesbania bispinosa]